jgi:hypothetical protein
MDRRFAHPANKTKIAVLPFVIPSEAEDLQFYGPFLGTSNLNENIIPLNTYGKYWNSFITFYSRPGRRIEGPRVPRTNDVAAFDHPFGQRSPPVGAFVIQRPNHSTDVGNTQRPAAGLELLRLAGTRQLPLAADPH